MPCYMGSDKGPIRQAIASKLPKIVEFLGNNRFLGGNEVTYIDFYFFELIQLMQHVQPSLFQTYPTLADYCRNV